MPRVHRAIFRKEGKGLCQLGLLKTVNILEWGDTTLIQTKNNGTVQFLTGVQEIKSANT